METRSITSTSTDGTAIDGWRNDSNGTQFWYEKGARQGYNVNDPNYRGKEIYDPYTDAWYGWIMYSRAQLQRIRTSIRNPLPDHLQTAMTAPENGCAMTTGV